MIAGLQFQPSAYFYTGDTVGADQSLSDQILK